MVLGKLGFWVICFVIATLVGLIIYFYKKDNSKQDNAILDIYNKTNNQESRLAVVEEKGQAREKHCDSQCLLFETKLVELKTIFEENHKKIEKKLWSEEKLSRVIGSVIEKEFLKFENKLLKKGVLHD